ncbi:MAG: glycerophosphodiester phosphodiesterase family protein [Rickettsiales bacterium]
MNKEEIYRYCEIYQPAIAAHRGASMRYPENSMAAFKEAINIAMESPEVRFFIEMDVRASKDGKLVLMHDSDVSRTTNGNGYTEEMSFAEIQKLGLKSVSEIVPSGHACPDRAQNPLFPITEQDLRVPALEEIVQLVKSANIMRGEIGSPIGLALEIKPKPPIKFFSRQTEFLAGMFSAALDKIGLAWLAEKMLPPTPSIKPLASILAQNVQSGDNVPMVLFSAAGAIGERDLKALWKNLSPEAKLNLMHQSGRHNPSLPYIADNLAQAMVLNQPHAAPFTDLSDDKPLMNGVQKAAEMAESFWLIGSLKPQTEMAKMTATNGIPVLTNCSPSDNPSDIKTAIENGATFITSNYPERAIRVLQGYMSKNSDYKNQQQEMGIESNFAEQEIRRRKENKASEVVIHA